MGIVGRIISRLSQLFDVKITAPSDGQVLAYSATDGKWENKDASSAGGVPSSRTIGTTGPLAGGGDLSANRTLSIPAATDLVNGYMTSVDHAQLTSNTGNIATNTGAIASNTADIATNASNLSTHSALTTTAHGGIVPSARTVGTTAPLAGGGALSSNLTLSIPAATDSVDGYMTHLDHAQLSTNTTNISTNTTNLSTHTALTTTAHGGIVPSARTISTTSPLNIGGGASADLTANRTIAFSNQSANTFLRGPTSGPAAAPSFAAITADDLPAILNGTSFTGVVTTSSDAFIGGTLEVSGTLTVGTLSSPQNNITLQLGDDFISTPNVTLDDGAGNGSFAGRVTAASILSTSSTAASGAIAASTPNLITQLWNSGTTSFSALTVNITNSASSATSKVLNQQLAGVTKFSTDVNGNATAAGTITAATFTGAVTASSGTFSGALIASGGTTFVGALTYNNSAGVVFETSDANSNTTVNGCNFTVGNLAVPSGVSVTPQGVSGSTTYGYRISAVNAQGETNASATVTTSTGNAALSSSNKNHLAWTAVAGATSYKVYGRTSGSELLIATVTAPTVTYDDIGTPAPSGALPANPAGTSLVVKAWANQTGFPFQLQNSAGTNVVKMDGSGNATYAGALTALSFVSSGGTLTCPGVNGGFQVTLNLQSSSGWSGSSSQTACSMVTVTSTNTGGTFTGVSIGPTLSTTSGASWRVLDINPTLTSDTSTGTKLLQRWAASGTTVKSVDVNGVEFLAAQAANPTAPGTDGQTNWYVKGKKLVFQLNDSGTTRYTTIDLTTGTVANSTTAP